MPSLVLTLDIGTSSVRCSAYDETAAYVETSRHVQAYRMDAEGTLPLPAVTAACEAVMDASLESLRVLQRSRQVVGVGISVFAMSWLGVDAAGSPVTPLYSYACRHGARAATALRQRLQRDNRAEEAYAASGVPVHTAYAPAQLLGLQTDNPDCLRAVAWWQTLGAFLLARWHGRVPAPVSTSEAGWTGLADRRRGVWHALWHDYVPTRDRLPPLRDYAHGLSGLAPAWAERWPELRAVPFFLPVGDGAAANVGSGAIDQRSLAVTVGTSAATRVLLSGWTPDAAPPTPPGLWCYRVDRTRHLLGGALTDGGNIIRWLYDLLAEDAHRLNREAAAVGPAGHGLIFLPFLNGERSPGWADSATLAIQGITARTRPGHLLRAGMEAVAFRLALIADLFADQVAADAPILASGGALEVSALWRQIMADVMQREVRWLKATETTSRGAAVLAWEALGQAAAIEADLPVQNVASPQPAAAAAYRTALQRHQDFYARLY